MDTYQAAGLAPDSVMSSAQPNTTAETIRIHAPNSVMSSAQPNITAETVRIRELAPMFVKASANC